MGIIGLTGVFLVGASFGAGVLFVCLALSQNR